jgi:signal transduction histidine kinase
MTAAGNAQARADKPGPPAFFRQGVLILAPVVLLAILGVFSLRQDAAHARHEAQERARVLAAELAEELWNLLTAPPAGPGAPRFSFRVDHEGRLLSPVPYDPLPAPQPFDGQALNSEQSRAWKRLTDSAPAANGPDAAIAAGRAFLALAPPERFTAAAHYRLGLLLAERGDLAAAQNAFRTVARDFPAVHSENGIPYEPMARLQLTELLVRGATNAAVGQITKELEALCAATVGRPSSLAPTLLARAAQIETNLGLTGVVQPWQQRRKDEEFCRRLFGSAHPQLFIEPRAASLVSNTSVVGINVPGLASARRLRPMVWCADPRASGQAQAPPDWLAVRTTEDTNGVSYACYSPFLLPLLDPPKPAGPQARDSNASMTLVVNLPKSNDFAFLGLLSPDLDSRNVSPLVAAWPRLTRRLPRYMGASLAIAGREILPASMLPRFVLAGGGKGTGPGWTTVGPQGDVPELLADSARLEAGIEQLRVGVHLTGPRWLYEKRRSRTRWVALLILASATVAVVGFVSARRAFTRQQRLAEMQSNFVSSVSHELRAPLASVRLMAESLERGRVPEAPKQQEYFRFIGQECRRLSSMIENLLDISRIEQGRREYHFEPADIRRLVEETVRLMEPAAAERTVRLTTRLPALEPGAPEPQFSFDALAVQQALVNLIDNALKHSPPASEVVVTLECLPASAVGADGEAGTAPSLRLTVTDQGPGVPVAERERIFERFHRLGAELRRETPGVGLGLSIVKHVVEAHDGRVWVEDAAGGGSRFVIELPASPAGALA